MSQTATLTMKDRYADPREFVRRKHRKKTVYEFTPEEKAQYSLEAAELRAVRVALARYNGNVAKAAALLGMNRRTLQRKFPQEIR